MHARLQSKPAAHAQDGYKPPTGADARVAQRLAPSTPGSGRHALAAPESVADFAQSYASGLARAAAAPGLPDGLKRGIETLSGISFDDVRVHRNSARPAQLQALAHTQGSDIHLGPGQERHLPHEAWHVVQQKQGRVRPTMRLGGTMINDDAGLEREADTMGSRALRMPRRDAAPRYAAPQAQNWGGASTPDVAQCVTVNVRRGQKMIQDQPPGNMAGKEFAWDSKFDLEVVGNTIVVTIKIKAAISAQQFQQVWADQVARQWSERFAVKYDGETYPIVVKLVQVDNGHHYAIDVVNSDSVYGHGNRAHFGTQNMTKWGAHDVTNVSHEVGHMLGNPDEYGEIEANGRTVNYLAKPSDTIMGKPANNPVAEHYDLIREYAETELRRIHKNAKVATVSRYLGGQQQMGPMVFNPNQAVGVTLKSSSQSSPKPKEEKAESELSKLFAKKKVWTEESASSISSSNQSSSSHTNTSIPSLEAPGFSFSSQSSQSNQSNKSSQSSLKPPSFSQSSQSSHSSHSSLGPPNFSFSNQSSQSNQSSLKPQSSSSSNSNAPKQTQEQQDMQKMLSNLGKAREKALEYPDNWVIPKLVGYIEDTIEQYRRGESQAWCVGATTGFVEQIDQAILEEEQGQ
ncbi:MAG TPA: DUF4157 domain-containing protein [Rhizomicrobium sp.]|jgi:hypothetical protein|nr:DUF4157 domain-containing protein [Rhizomicrobium sp.]